MRGKDLLECMEYIDDALIEEALEPAVFPHRTGIVARWGMAAACVVVIGISATALWSHQNIRDKHFEGGSDSAAQMEMNAAAGNSTGNMQESPKAEDTAAEDQQADAYEEAAYEIDDAGRDVITEQSVLEDAASVKENTDKHQDLKNDGKELEETKKMEYVVINDYYGEKDSSAYDYPIPEKGQSFCYHMLQETMEYYAEQENADAADSPIYAYDVVIDVYGDIGGIGTEGIYYDILNTDDTDLGNAMIEQEYRRLTELGYAVRLSEDFQLTGTLTKVEIDTFQALPEYGYVFRFASEF